MLGKLKQAGNDVKRSVGDLKAHTEIEAEYLKAKSKNTFDHPHDIILRTRMAADIQLSYEELLANVVDWVEKYQEVINSEVRAAERFKEKIAQKQHLPQGVISKKSTQFAEYQNEMHQLRQTQLGIVLEYIQLPVKKILFDMIAYKSKLESLNRLSVEVKYWKTRLNHTKQLQDITSTYESTMKQFKEYVDGLHRAAEQDYPKKLAAFQQAQLEFFSGAASLILLDTTTTTAQHNNKQQHQTQQLSPFLDEIEEPLQQHYPTPQHTSSLSSLSVNDDAIIVGKSRASSLGGDGDSSLAIRGRGSFRNRSGSTVENVRI